MNEFEQRLRQVPLKPVPVGWRAEILAAAQPAPPQARNQTWWHRLNGQLSALLWPHPKAWAGLAAVWIFILLLNFSSRDEAPIRAEKAAPPSPEVLVELRQQQQLLVELLGAHEATDADRPKPAAPQPHAQLTQLMMG